MGGGCALVTGASRGIGAATARALAGDGRAVAIAYRSHRDGAEQVKAEIEADGGWAETFQLDVCNGAIDDVFTAVEEALGPVEVLVNNAGLTAVTLSVAMSDDQWSRVIETNLSGVIEAPSIPKNRSGFLVKRTTTVSSRPNFSKRASFCGRRVR